LVKSQEPREKSIQFEITTEGQRGDPHSCRKQKQSSFSYGGLHPSPN
jgi:hypothetical protein